MVAMRFFMMAVALVPFCGVPKRQEWLPIFSIASLVGAVHFGLLYCGISRVDASTSAIAYQLSTPFTLLLAFAVLKERIGLQVVAGIVIALLGVLTVLGGVGQGGALSGVLLVIAAAFVLRWDGAYQALGAFQPRSDKRMDRLDCGAGVTDGVCGGGGHAWGSVLTASPKAWAAVVYTAVSGGLIGFGLWYWLLGRHPVQRLTPFLLLVPVFAVAVSQLLLQEGYR